MLGNFAISDLHSLSYSLLLSSVSSRLMGLIAEAPYPSFRPSLPPQVAQLASIRRDIIFRPSLSSLAPAPFIRVEWDSTLGSVTR